MMTRHILLVFSLIYWMDLVTISIADSILFNLNELCLTSVCVHGAKNVFVGVTFFLSAETAVWCSQIEIAVETHVLCIEVRTR